MKILVDADACPVKDIIKRIALEFGVNVILFIDTSHFMNDNDCETIMVDKGRDSVDIALVNKTENGDIVVTQDYGLGAMVLTKRAFALNQNGLIYSDENIDELLMRRHIGQKVRRAGGKTAGPPKRTEEDNLRFEKSLRKLLERSKL